MNKMIKAALNKTKLSFEFSSIIVPLFPIIHRTIIEVDLNKFILHSLQLSFFNDSNIAELYFLKELYLIYGILFICLFCGG